MIVAAGSLGHLSFPRTARTPLSHTALARKYRPRSFRDVATQEHVSETLRRAVAGGRVGHAYLFCGPRGVGKTTLARVLAMALNCADRAEDGEPCGVCESCSRIWGGHTALDVVEIDAASNRGVDDARDLRERAMYAPSGEERYKVYIVDEAHMLTREAWNALLKILEEPPPRVIFVFATTEPQKIQQSAAPILSRCQRFDFRRIGVGDIVARLEAVLAGEATAAPEDALRMIARKADGGMRDALSLLDQVLALTGGAVDAESVRRVLGLVEEERYLEVMDILLEGRHQAVFDVVERLLDDGYDLVEFYHGLLEALRSVLRLNLDPQARLELSEELRAAYAERAAAFAAPDLVRMLAAAAELEQTGSLRRSANPRVLVEMLLLRLSFIDRTVGLEELLRALGGAPPPTGGAPSPRGSGGRGSDPRDATPASGGQPGDAESRGQGDVPVADRAVAGTEAAHSAPAVPEPPVGPEGGRMPPQAAWERWLEEGRGIPSGLRPFLRTAKVSVGPDGAALRVGVVPGPAEERLADPVVRDAIAEGIAPYLGYRPEVAVEPLAERGSNGQARISQDEVREDTLRTLFREEPRLERAVQELDLELLD